MAIKGRSLLLLFFLCFFLFSSTCDSKGDRLVQGEKLRDSDPLISASGTFKLGFFSVDASGKRYLGIWYTKYVDKKVWVANRDDPIPDSSGYLTIDDDDGRLRIIHSGGSKDLASNYTKKSSIDTSLILRDDGNLILRDKSSDGREQVLWQSFDYPTDTLLPGMKLGVNLKTGHKWSLTSWVSSQLPSPGSFTLGAEFSITSSQLVIWKNNKVYWVSGSWGNQSLSFYNLQNSSKGKGLLSFEYVSNENEMSFTFSIKDIDFPMLEIHPSGLLIGAKTKYVNCRGNLWSGCREEKGPQCRSSTRNFTRNTVYAPRDGIKFEENMNIIDCEAKCQDSCDCVAYASTNEKGFGCEIWIKQLSEESSYVRAREIYCLPSSQDESVAWFIYAATVIVGGSLVLIACSLSYLGWEDFNRKGGKSNRQQELLFELGAITKSLTKYGNLNKLEKNGKSTNELQLFSFQSIATATNNFSAESKLGEGGFGPVYKGILLDKQEIAIKKLSRSSGQGLEEFKNEIVLIGKLQHNNLVRLLGCCIKGEEKILIYEYLPNKSLDFFLFDPTKQYLLDWKKRYNIVEGIAQGLLYLHKYSRLKVVHRDLKPSNILLDNEMNPKISDFGMARIFGRNESQANTRRIVGTYGYMSPEYAMEGIFSMKSDVFSFGVLLLEIVSGRKNYSNYYYKRPLNLIGYAWELWKEGRSLELMDQTLGDLCPINVIRRCIHVGLLCVQENPIDRPTMSDVLFMLSNESMQLSTPKQPAFFIGRSVQESKIPTSRSENCSLNNVSISELEAR